MGIDGSRRTIHNINSSAISSPARHAGGIVLIGVCNAPVMFLFVLVFRGVRSRIAALPEAFDELISFRVRGQLLKGGKLFIGDDPADVFIQPFLVDAAQFFALRALVVFFSRTFQRVLLRIRLGLAGRGGRRGLLVLFCLIGLLGLD